MEPSPLPPLPAVDADALPPTHAPSPQIDPPPFRWRSPLWKVILLLLLGTVGWGLWRVVVAPEAPLSATAQQPPLSVEALPLEPVTIAERSEYVAQVRSRQAVTLRPRAQGQITQIAVQPGQRVAAGTVLLQIDPAQQQAAVESGYASVAAAQATVDSAEALLRSLEAERISKAAEADLSQVDYQRYASLAEAGAIPRQTQDQYATRLQVARANVQAIDQQIQAQRAAVARAVQAVQEAQARVREQQVQLQYFQITAPFDGMVGEIPVKVGDLVDPTTALLTLADNTDLEINLSLPVSQAAQVSLGQRLALVDDEGQPLGESTISFIAPITSNATQSVQVKAQLRNAPPQLRTDQFVRAQLTWQQRPGLQVPSTAIARFGGETFVFVAVPDEGGWVAQQRLVELGALQGNHYTVLSGLAAGDRLILSNLFSLRDGLPILPSAPAPPPPNAALPTGCRSRLGGGAFVRHLHAPPSLDRAVAGDAQNLLL